MTWLKAIFQLADELNLWRHGLSIYINRRAKRSFRIFETYKDMIVDVLVARRGMYQRPFMHFSVGMLFVAGVVTGPILADTYPGSSPGDSIESFTPPSAVVTSLDFSEYGVNTTQSEKPRDTVLDYTVAEGDTISSIAEKFDVSVDTIRWANDLTRDTLKIGQVIKIPPVTGIVHKVREGETVYSIAKKYKTEAQGIANFPFNEFSDLDTFALNVGQTLVVPEGVMPQAAPAPIKRTPTTISPQGPIASGGSGQFMWPATGLITQYPVWYHMALDIANRAAPPIAASDGGTVTVVQFLRYGYGFHVIIDHGNGFQTLYGHMSEIYVKPGDVVSRGQVIGKMGSTGRSTGTHLHFEIRKNGVIVNPLTYLK